MSTEEVFEKVKAIIVEQLGATEALSPKKVITMSRYYIDID